MPHLELKFEHYCAIRDFMEEIELMDGDEMSPREIEALRVVNQIILNIEKRRAQDRAQNKIAPRYRRRRVA